MSVTGTYLPGQSLRGVSFTVVGRRKYGNKTPPGEGDNVLEKVIGKSSCRSIVCTVWPGYTGRETYNRLDPALIRRFAEKKLMYVRNFIEGLDVSWQQFFQTTCKERVEVYCRRAAIHFEWKGEHHLRTSQICPAVVKHPCTGEMLFFNQIQLHHVSCLDPETRASMLSMFPEEDLPRNVYYGDGTALEDAVVKEISDLYEQLAVRFQWQAGDAIVLDNMMTAHARDPFEGTRKILVAMADIVFQKDVVA